MTIGVRNPVINMHVSSTFGLRPWMGKILLAAAVYNIIWGGLVVGFPTATLAWAGLDSPLQYPQIWQCLGMVVGVYGIGYAIAAKDPFRHWPIVLVGLLGKLLGPIGFLFGLLAGTLPGSMGWMILLNDLIWWVPFAMILWQAFYFHQITIHHYAQDILDDDPVHELLSNHQKSLHQLSLTRPQLVVFLRHAGCTFCREALADLGNQRREIEGHGCGLVLVHLGADESAERILSERGLADVPRISDPECRLYQQFGLEMGRFRQLLGGRVWLRGIQAGLVNGHGIGAIEGNPLQMPGAFLVANGRFLSGFQHESAADRPNYLEFVRDGLVSAETAAAANGSPAEM